MIRPILDELQYRYDVCIKLLSILILLSLMMTYLFISVALIVLLLRLMAFIPLDPLIAFLLIIVTSLSRSPA
ncbi:hypothetical protein C497_05652 [Halalkalicoccus jeotgali B3]|uniref:Uncharacterized protein n=1 Tax=Halalkalicoccus jeotgali (strain DSM 18796 / CECT 7217 / JCM 14584 / KCTC 4019 / B3) TaxID=795797 RepID=D8JAW1_HALJB|nr:hypothetical protein HacjB3_07240 [Halalkalicoccus jeotgali B3]ELY39416.1 hypothetical protein C497_05652 [Halalkalicoccus jeotgali B3]